MSDGDDRGIEHLTLPEPAASLFRRTREALETHIGRHTPQPAIGQGRALIDARPVTVLTNTQIINGKLHNRSLDRKAPEGRSP